MKQWLVWVALLNLQKSNFNIKTARRRSAHKKNPGWVTAGAVFFA